MKKEIGTWLGVALGAAVFMLLPGQSFAVQPEAPPAGVHQSGPAQAAPAQKVAQTAPSVQIKMDKTSLDNHGTINLSGTAPAGKPVYVEVWSDRRVRTSNFDTKPDKKTGKRPYIFYMTNQMPAYYKILIPTDKGSALKALKAQGKSWNCSLALKDCGAQGAFKAPEAIPIKSYQASLLGSIIGSRGTLLPVMGAKEDASEAARLLKVRFRSPGVIFIPDVETKPDGSFTAKIVVPEGSPKGRYNVRAVVGDTIVSKTLSFENTISFPYVYLTNAGTTMNLFWPFLLSFAVCTFGVLMGAGGGFILNPLLVLLWPLPPAVVAGTVMPTVLFSQGSGIYNYSKIKFINWKLGIAIGLAMLLGGFIGPELTELITLSQFKFVFGLILIVLAGLMAWQTTPAYVAKNKKEKAILQQFRKKAEEAAAAKKAGVKVPKTA